MSETNSQCNLCGHPSSHLLFSEQCYTNPLCPNYAGTEPKPGTWGEFAKIQPAQVATGIDQKARDFIEALNAPQPMACNQRVQFNVGDLVRIRQSGTEHRVKALPKHHGEIFYDLEGEHRVHFAGKNLELVEPVAKPTEGTIIASVTPKFDGYIRTSGSSVLHVPKPEACEHEHGWRHPDDRSDVWKCKDCEDFFYYTLQVGDTVRVCGDGPRKCGMDQISDMQKLIGDSFTICFVDDRDEGTNGLIQTEKNIWVWHPDDLDLVRRAEDVKPKPVVPTAYQARYIWHALEPGKHLRIDDEVYEIVSKPFTEGESAFSIEKIRTRCVSDGGCMIITWEDILAGLENGKTVTVED